MNSIVVRLDKVSKCYHLGEVEVQALSAMDLQVNAGEIVALEGPSGSGKSTLLNICGLIDIADSGEVALSGREVSHLTARERTRLRRETIGFIFQSFNLVPVMTAYENIEYPLLLANVPAAQRRQRVQEMLARVGLAQFADHVPDRLSGGQRQRVAIARALVKRPALVIADEPTASLDSQTAQDVVDIMRDLAGRTGTAFLVATHDARMSEHCQRSIGLHDGRLQ